MAIIAQPILAQQVTVPEAYSQMWDNWIFKGIPLFYNPAVDKYKTFDNRPKLSIQEETLRNNINNLKQVTRSSMYSLNTSSGSELPNDLNFNRPFGSVAPDSLWPSTNFCQYIDLTGVQAYSLNNSTSTTTLNNSASQPSSNTNSQATTNVYNQTNTSNNAASAPDNNSIFRSITNNNSNTNASQPSSNSNSQAPANVYNQTNSSNNATSAPDNNSIFRSITNNNSNANTNSKDNLPNNYSQPDNYSQSDYSSNPITNSQPKVDIKSIKIPDDYTP